MLFREIIAVYRENHTEHINTLCVQNEELLNVKSIKILRGFSPLANYTDRAIAAGQRS
jgi:hypothetical protein